MYSEIIKCLQAVKGSSFNEDNNLISEGWIDSFDFVKLIGALEEAFSVDIPNIEINPENFDSVERIENLISQIKR